MKTEVTNIEAVEAEHAHHDHSGMNSYGFWIYLMSDLVIFSVLFATFVVLGKNYAGGPGPKDLFHLPFVFVETMLLLVSSVTYGFAMIALQNKNKNGVITGLIVTFLLGAGFIGMELFEFYELIVDGHGPDKSGFLSAFFTLVGTHGTHVFFGLIWMALLIIQLTKRGITEGVSNRLTLLSLFWHFLDIVWVGVFTVVYLLGMV